ncbi:succinylglutamate desuccinylase/aspartoacylase family protein [Mesorhizobium sp.]|uniref:succinylglutamate desuccinylase/aspartoacylase domain-containing protein n=1 Tax=Mesorhizobium sp. TaxID=1871066 RepID=UPI0025BC686F|nr:succinylglutamate desuccinylase/aspartoacylase family protein [Mesorhizobium sp.]
MVAAVAFLLGPARGGGRCDADRIVGELGASRILITGGNHGNELEGPIVARHIIERLGGWSCDRP